MDAIVRRDYRKMRMISDFFYAASGIYQTVCNYFAFLYRYDWYVYPENVKESAKPEKVIEEYTKILTYLDGSYIKKLCGEIALKVVKYGCYYAYIVDGQKDQLYKNYLMNIVEQDIQLVDYQLLNLICLFLMINFMMQHIV